MKGPGSSPNCDIVWRSSESYLELIFSFVSYILHRA